MEHLSIFDNIERVKEAGYTEDEYKMLEYQWFNLGYLMDYQRMMNLLEPIAQEGYVKGLNEKEDYESIKKRLIENRQKEKENAQENVENTAVSIQPKTAVSIQPKISLTSWDAGSDSKVNPRCKPAFCGTIWETRSY